MKYTFRIKNARDILDDKISFNQMFPDALVPKQCTTGQDIWFRVLRGTADRIEVGDPLIEVFFYRTDDSYKGHRLDDVIGHYIIHSERSGYINHSFSNSTYSIDCLEEPIDIYPTIEEYQDELLPINYEIRKDDFTSEKHIIWKWFNNDDENAISSNYILQHLTIIELTTDKNLPVMALHFNKKSIKARKKDSISFKFLDGTLLHFPILSTPLVSEKYSGANKFLLPLNHSDIEKFANCPWEKMRIEHINGDAPETIDNKQKYEDKAEFSQTLFMKYALLYKVALSEIGIIPQIKGNSDNYHIEDNAFIEDACYVYLMVDTSNGYHKIGISNHPEYRERTLQSEKPSIEKICAKKYPTRIIAQSIESALHTAFSAKRIRGEWFNLTENDVKQIIATLS